MKQVNINLKINSKQKILLKDTESISIRWLLLKKECEKKKEKNIWEIILTIFDIVLTIFDVALTILDVAETILEIDLT